MRIISGKYKGFRFPKHQLNQTRPTTDRAKEALMSILQSKTQIEGAQVLELYAGTGNVSFELLSRGAGSAELVEFSSAAIAYQKSIAQKMSCEISVRKSKVIPFLQECNKQYDIIFADPPYMSNDYNLLLELVQKNNLLKPSAVLIVEHDSKRLLPQKGLLESRSYGQSTFSFFTFE